MQSKSPYNWKEIQAAYDEGKSFTTLKREFGMANATLVNATKRGDLKARTKSEAQKLHIKQLSQQTNSRIRSTHDWNNIQAAYNAGASWRDLNKQFGLGSRSISLAKARGEFSGRNNVESFNKYKEVHGRFPGGPMGDLARQKLSEEQSKRNRGGKCKWFDVDGVKVQGTWERDLALKFNALGIVWQKPCLGRDIWRYVDDAGKARSYTPDFYLPEFDTYIELKGYWWGDDRRKMELVREQHCDKKLLIVEKDEYRFCLLNC